MAAVVQCKGLGGADAGVDEGLSQGQGQGKGFRRRRNEENPDASQRGRELGKFKKHWKLLMVLNNFFIGTYYTRWFLKNPALSKWLGLSFRIRP